MENVINIRQLGLTSYLEVYQIMHNFTMQRTELTLDEIWLTEHHAVFTQGKTGSPEHLLSDTGSIPIIQTDRGGQITYHGPGQQIMYTMIDIKRRKLSIRQMVSYLEQSVIETLAKLGIKAEAKKEAPGVYVNEQKICSLGLHIKNGRTLHGLALNIAMDLTPFKLINPCGYAGLAMTQVSQQTTEFDRTAIAKNLVDAFAQSLQYQQIHYL
ncbi:lipoyl(octanoyl) transferase LipB [Utexia brackfieldae]